MSGSGVVNQVEEVQEERILRAGRCLWCGEKLLGLTCGELLMVWLHHAPMCPAARDTARRRAAGCSRLGGLLTASSSGADQAMLS